MDNGTLALILSPLAIILTGIITQFVTRRNHRDDTDISGFQANLDAYAGRATYAEQRALAAEQGAVEMGKRLVAVEGKVSDLEHKYEAQSRQITRMRNAVRDWFKQLKAWDKTTPMPLPSKEDRELLGITEEE